MKLFLSGAETGHAGKTLIEVNAPFVMFSYFYLKRKSATAIRDILASFKGYGAEVAVHPGIQSITNNIGESNEGALEKYILKYFDFVDKNKDSISVAFAPDPFGFLPKEQIYTGYGKLSEIIEDPFIMPEKPTKECIDEIKHISKRIALPSGLQMSQYSRLISPEAKREKLLFHCLGTTKFNVISKLPWYSVDSGTWLSGGRFGAIYKYKGGLKLDRIIDSDTKDATKASRIRSLRPRFDEKGISYKKIISNDSYELNKWNALQWLEFSDDIIKRKQNSAYWTKPSPSELPAVRPSKEMSLDVVAPSAMTFGQDPRLNVMRQCNSCIISDRCPAFKPNSDCTLTNTPDIDSVADLDSAANALLKAQMDRLVHAMLVERLEGGVLTEEVSLEVERTMKMLTAQRKAVTTSKDSITIAGEGAGASLLANLLGGMTRGTSGPDGRSQGAQARRASAQRKAEALNESEQETDTAEAEIIDMD